MSVSDDIRGVALLIERSGKNLWDEPKLPIFMAIEMYFHGPFFEESIEFPGYFGNDDAIYARERAVHIAMEKSGYMPRLFSVSNYDFDDVVATLRKIADTA